MDDAEARALDVTMAGLVGKYHEGYRFTAADLRAIHRDWLGEIYVWAGGYRQVNVSKGEFTFAAAARVPALMDEFDRKILARHTPCNDPDRTDIVRALAETHVELVLIRPFREGNGRLARILSTLMALQAGLPLLDFSLIAGEGRSGTSRRYWPASTRTTGQWNRCSRRLSSGALRLLEGPSLLAVRQRTGDGVDRCAGFNGGRASRHS
ncbi:MAG: Fic family protein [Chromatiales bacterium]|nr:Fic family protein [Chromatiales bacterium]